MATATRGLDWRWRDADSSPEGHMEQRWACLGFVAYNHIRDMVCHMKTTLNIDAAVMADLKREAARQGRTMSELVETALRLLLKSQRKKIKPLPTFNGGGELVDIADRNALYDAMEDR
jgi:Arc/MetJ family transcription regulator